MSVVVDNAREILAALQPITGDRAACTVNVKAAGPDVVVPRNTYLLPVVDGQLRADLPFKTDKGPGAKGAWTATAAGTDVSVFSNVGGARHNVDLTRLTAWRFDPPLAGIASVDPVDGPAGGADPEGFGGLKNAVVFETFGGSQNLDIFRAKIGAFPAALIFWVGTEPADGNSNMSKQAVHVGRGTYLYRENYRLLFITSRKDADTVRRNEGQQAMDDATVLLLDTGNVDGFVLSSPAFTWISRRYKLEGDDKLYQDFYVYGIELSIMTSYSHLERRTFNDLLKARLTVEKQEANLPTDPDFLVQVDDVEIDMAP